MVKTNPQGYPTELFWSEEDEGYIALAPDLPGCSAWGKTEIEALTELRDAIEAWQESAISAGNPVPQPSIRSGTQAYSGRFVARVPRSLHRELAERAKVDGISQNQLVVYLLTKALHAEPLYEQLPKSQVVHSTRIYQMIIFNVPGYNSPTRLGETYYGANVFIDMSVPSGVNIVPVVTPYRFFYGGTSEGGLISHNVEDVG